MPVFYEAPQFEVESAQSDASIAWYLQVVADSPFWHFAVTHWPPAICALILFLIVRRGYERTAVPVSGAILVLDAWHFGFLG